MALAKEDGLDGGTSQWAMSVCAEYVNHQSPRYYLPPFFDPTC